MKNPRQPHHCKLETHLVTLTTTTLKIGRWNIQKRSGVASGRPAASRDLTPRRLLGPSLPVITFQPQPRSVYRSTSHAAAFDPPYKVNSYREVRDSSVICDKTYWCIYFETMHSNGSIASSKEWSVWQQTSLWPPPPPWLPPPLDADWPHTTPSLFTVPHH